MSIEIIDLTNIPDSPPSTPKSSSNAPNILNYVHVSTNSDLHQHIHHHQHQTTLLVPPATTHPYETGQLATGWLQPSMQHNRVATALTLLPESNIVQLSNGVRFTVPWSQFEHENINSSSAKETLTLLPESAPYHQVATIYRGEASNNNNNYGMVEMMKDGASTSMTLLDADSANEKVDLELRLGLY